MSVSADSLVIEEYADLTTEGAAVLADRIDALTRHQIRDLRVVPSSQKITLQGCSKSYYVKQLASQAAVDLLPGINVQNNIDVVP